MNKYTPADKLIAEIERRLSEIPTPKVRDSDSIENFYRRDELMRIKKFVHTLQQEQPKFNVGDFVVSKKNPHLTYKILETNIPNELGNTDYKVEIFTDGKPGLLDKPHNIHLIDSDKIEDWGELVQQEQPDGLDEAAIIYINTPRIKSEKDKVFDEISRNHEYLAFKAGAAWMAGQGETVEKTVDLLEHQLAGHTYFTHGVEVDEFDVPFLNSKEVGCGDKVVVQIRKK